MYAKIFNLFSKLWSKIMDSQIIDSTKYIEIEVPIYPRSQCSSSVDWVIKTLNYIGQWEYYEYENKIFNGNQILPLLPEKINQLNLIEDSKIRDAALTAHLIFPEYGTEIIEQLLQNDDSRDFGIALSIQKGLIKNILDFGEMPSIILLLTEQQLCDQDLAHFQDLDLIKRISDQVVDSKQTMYTTLLVNLGKILSNIGYAVIDRKFISKYLNRGLFLQGSVDSFLKNILENTVENHPKFSELDCLAWDPFTKSRRYSHWLNSISRMDQLIQYYREIPECCKCNQDNIDYICKYEKFKSVYKDCF
jgi:hypothetical protein